jgi:hypothetical protein
VLQAYKEQMDEDEAEEFLQKIVQVGREGVRLPLPWHLCVASNLPGALVAVG